MNILHLISFLERNFGGCGIFFTNFYHYFWFLQMNNFNLSLNQDLKKMKNNATKLFFTDPQFIKKIEEMNLLSPSYYYMMMTNNLFLPPEIKILISDLSIEYKLNNGIINCIFDYVFLKNKQKFFSTKYAIKIAITINQLKLTNLYDVINHLKLAHLKSNINF